METYQEVERSIIKTYRKEIWRPFIRAIKDYEMIQNEDKIMVCISGGKDSFLMAKCFQELQKHGQMHFEVVFVVMDPGYKEENRKAILENAELLHIPIQFFETSIFQIVSSVASKSPCYLCARMRRGHLYNKAKELGCNKIALGHHFDDFIETTLLSMFYGSEVKTMMPKLHSDHFLGIDLIRPLCFVKESSILSWKNKNHLTFLNCACHFTEKASQYESLSKRKEMKEIIEFLRDKNPEIDHNLFKALENVNLNCVLGYRKDGKYHHFLDDY